MEFEMATDGSKGLTDEEQQRLTEFGLVSAPIVKILDEFPHDQIKLVLDNIEPFKNNFFSFFKEEIDMYLKEKSSLEELSIEFPVEPKNEDDFS